MSNAKPARRGVPQPLHGGPQRFGPYSLEARLAVGTTTEVYLARLVGDDGAPGRAEPPQRLVVKRLLPHLVTDADGRSRFEREALLHSAVVHENVVKVLGAGTTDQGEPYLAMEYVDGCDAFRLLRRTTHERTTLPIAVSLRIAREVLLGLAAVHAARDEAGVPLETVHRDVTPSNVYLSRDGDVKLGDFGIARSLCRSRDMASSGEIVAQDASLMGKFSYLAPEQVAGEPFDHRADLFSLATVLAELLIGKPLFPGTGQLQVLLAIRDCNLKPLHEVKDRLPAGLLPVLEKGLARDPALRFAGASEFVEALAPFGVVSGSATDDRVKRELAARVAAVQSAPSESQLAQVRESARAMRAAAAVPAAEIHEATDELPTHDLDQDLDLEVAFADELDVHDRDTGLYPELKSFVQKSTGERTGPWTFVKLVEGIGTGAIRRGDLVDFLGMGLRPIEEVPDLNRLLPKGTVPPAPPPTAEPAYSADLAATTMLDVLAHVLVGRQSGLMLLEKPSAKGELAQHREVYFLRGRLHHVVSSNAGERLGEFLVRRGKLSREELDLALAVLPRYGGRIGDTLIGLGLVDGVDIFRAIREQGRERVTDLFLWQWGTANFHPETKVPAVEFPLDLDLATLMVAGLEASHPGDAPMAFIEPQLDAIVAPNARPEIAGFAWPPLVAVVRDTLAAPMTLHELLSTVTKAAGVTGADVARALEVLLAVDLARWQ